MARAEEFHGTIGRTLAESEPWFDEPPHPGDAPNVVVVVLDDTGFAQLGCYGGEVSTPNIDALAASGLRFTNFHVTPLCSPTRAELLTGRASHEVGMRALANFRTGFPNQLGHISNRASTMAEVLGDEGYATFCVGKWHLAPLEDCSAAGPFGHWPIARGFDRFYGFLEGETDQFNPQLVADNHPVEPPARPEEGYHLSEDLVDQAISMIANSVGVRPDRPFFTYLAFGAAHAPHQAPAEYLERYRGRFDEGWDVARERTFARQIEMGLLPEGAKLAPRNPGVEPWDSLPEMEQRLAARLQEAFAAFMEHTDAQIGRFVEGLARLGQFEDTILVVVSDNGASQEGGPYGVMHEMKFFNGILETPEEAIERIDDIGGPHSHTNYPWGWAQAGNTPFKWYKQNTHEGGVHVPMLVHWPAGIAEDERGGLRHQFTEAADLAPTLYELLGVTAPEVRNGLEQMPVTGRSFATVLDDADAPPTNRHQLFEMAGSRAMVVDGWKAVCRHVRGADWDAEPWELYDLSSDPSECEDLAEEHPDKLQELIATWWEEAERRGALPLDERTIELFGVRHRERSAHPPDRRYVYRPPMLPLPAQAAPPIAGRNSDVTARVEGTAGDEGVLFASGTENCGFSFFVQDRRLVLDYNAFDDHTVLVSSTEVPEGEAELVLRLRRGEGRTGSASLAIDGQEAGEVEIPLYLRIFSSVGSSIGSDPGSAVSPRYVAPFAYSGTLHEVEVQIATGARKDVDEATARSEMSRQ